jgi:hypothetical protein
MAKPTQDWQAQILGLANNMVAAVVFAGVAMIATTIYGRYGTAWTWPIVEGIVSFFVVLSIFMVIRVLLSLPLAKERISTENIEMRLLEWVYKFRLSVKNEPAPDVAHFRICVTTNEKHIYIARPKNDWNDYLEFWANMREADRDEQALIDGLTSDETAWILVSLKMELARMRMGYSGFISLGSGYRIIKRIPITESLREDEVINMIWEMEAALNELFYLVVKSVHLAKIGKLVEVS